MEIGACSGLHLALSQRCQVVTGSWTFEQPLTSRTMQPSVAKPVTPEQSVGGARELEFIIERMIGKFYTISLVKVVGVHAGGTGPVGFLSAVDLLQQVDGSNNGIP